MRLKILSALVALAVAPGCDNDLSADPTTGPGNTWSRGGTAGSGGSGGQGGGDAGGDGGGGDTGGAGGTGGFSGGTGGNAGGTGGFAGGTGGFAGGTGGFAGGTGGFAGGTGGFGGNGGNSGSGSSQQQLLSPDGRYAFELEHSESGDEIVIFRVETDGRQAIDAIRIPDGAELLEVDPKEPRLFLTYPDRQLTLTYDLENAR